MRSRINGKRKRMGKALSGEWLKLVFLLALGVLVGAMVVGQGNLTDRGRTLTGLSPLWWPDPGALVPPVKPALPIQPKRRAPLSEVFWYALVLIYPNTDTDYMDEFGEIKHFKGSLTDEQVANLKNAVNNWIMLTNSWSNQWGKIIADVKIISRPISSVTKLGDNPLSYWVECKDVRVELDTYFSLEKYDSVIVLWYSGDIPTDYWGLAYVGPVGGTYGGNYVTFTYGTIIYGADWWWGGKYPGEVILHEWLHGLEGYYQSLGYSIPGLHDAEKYGYHPDPDGSWKPWYSDYMQGKVISNGEYMGISYGVWLSGSIYRVNRPLPCQLISPLNDTLWSTQNPPTLKWAKVPADKFYVAVYKAIDPNHPIISTYTTNNSWTIPGNELNGNAFRWSVWSIQGTTFGERGDTLMFRFIDTVEPTNLTISINNNAKYTKSILVTLTLSALSADYMSFSNDGINWSAWEPYSNFKLWTLTPEDGEKIVYFKCKDEAGNESLTTYGTIILDTIPPNTPSNLKVNSVNLTEIELSWDVSIDEGSGLAGYVIERSISEKGPFNNIGNTILNSYKDENLSIGTKYYYRVKAYDNAGNYSKYSNIASATTKTRPPETPILLSPVDKIIVSSNPTFKIIANDLDGDKVRFEIELIKDSEKKIFTTDFVDSRVEAIFTVPSDQALLEGQWSWRARAIDSRGETGEWSETRTIQVISVPLINSGLRLVACPVLNVPTEPKSVFAFDDEKWAWYDPTSGYLLYPNSQTNLQVGKGYWAKFVQDTKPNIEGNLPDATKPFSISLKKGWNLIGNPWLVDLVWDLSSIHVKMGGQEKALKDLGENEGVEPYAWRWDGSNYRLVFDRTIITGVDYTLPSWEGAWAYAHTDCELVLPPPSQSKGRGTRDRGQVVKSNGWSVRLQASVNGSVGEAVIGIAQGGRGLSVGLPPEPPTGNNGVQVILLKNNTPLAIDVRSDGSRRQEWEVLVRWDKGQGTRGKGERKEVTLTFDGIGYVPKDVSAWLVDMVTGKRLYLRTQSSYRFVAQEGEVERKFKVIVERGNDRPLRVVGLRATSMKGQGIVISFSLTKPAQVFVEVLTLTGRRVAVLEGSGERVVGEQRMVWRGVKGEGLAVSSGAYLVRVIATDDEGRQVQGTIVVRVR